MQQTLPLELARTPSPIAEEAEEIGVLGELNNGYHHDEAEGDDDEEDEEDEEDDDDEDDNLSSSYVRTIRRIIKRSQSIPNANFSASYSYPASPTISARFEYPSNNLSPQRHSLRDSFMDNSELSTDNQTFEFDFNNNQAYQLSRPAPLTSRYLPSTTGGSLQGRLRVELPQLHHQHHQQHSPNQKTTMRSSKEESSFNYNNYHNQQANSERLSAGDLSSEGSGSEPADLSHKWSWRNLKREFKLSHSEDLFHLYQAKLQHSFFVASLILNIIFNLGAILSYLLGRYSEMNLYLILMRFTSTFVYVAFLVLIWYNKLWLQSKFSRTVASLAVLSAMIFGEASGAICALVNDQAAPLASIRRTYYLIITNHVFLPFPTRLQACAATIIITSCEIAVTYISRRDNSCRADYLTLYSIADIIFYATSAMIGFQITFLLEIAIRRTFMNHKYCIQSTYKLNYEKEQQEQLLRSCFPQHLIEQIRSEIRESIARISKRQSVPFKPFYNLYVEKYENVTILYADIVNSMNLTDKLQPAELVETLNELYGRFDESAEKYNCLRIKLLGDCYYCVSGLPEYDAAHAIKSVLMGLEMIRIINSIRQSRQVDIDMRIGIHTGSVLSGLLGLRKWQFDIWSFDAMQANRMEHNGQPGFVHITQETLDSLPQDHPRRKELIITATRQSDDSKTTYLISEKICPRTSKDSSSPQARRRGQTEKLKAYIEKLRMRSTGSGMDFTQRRMALESSLKKYREIHAKVDQTMRTAIDEMPLGSAWKQFFFIDCLGLAGAGGGAIDGAKVNAATSGPNGGGGGNRRSANDENKSARASADASKSNKGINPIDKALLQSDPLFHLYLICVGLITLSILAIKCLIPGMPIYMHTIIGFAFLLAIIIGSTIYTQSNSRKINASFRILLWLIISASLTMLQLVDLIVPDEFDPIMEENFVDISHAESLNCAFAWYYTFTIIVAMTATSIFIRINVWLKFITHSLTIAFYIIINNPPASMFETLKQFFQNQGSDWSLLDHKQELSHLLYIVMIAVILHLIDRQVEYILSLNIQWNEQLEEDRAESQTVGQINRILLENILPPHVLKRYLYNTTVSYDQLYHESHPSCAVMFASIPNYENFYTENNLNEQGLKCLQLLNEIICDFDQLLSHPAYRTIEKIKTIGSTYMAACFDGIEISNVVTMVRFATDLMLNLNRINRDAFQEFRLRIGIAIGPVIAGVVGASKPTYDIWGDTVNVASRLESNGVSGRIQVSEQVAEILAKHGQFDTECRGPIEVKGKGQLTTYLVVTEYDNVAESDELESNISNLNSPDVVVDFNEIIGAHDDDDDDDDYDDMSRDEASLDFSAHGHHQSQPDNDFSSFS